MSKNGQVGLELVNRPALIPGQKNSTPETACGVSSAIEAADSTCNSSLRAVREIDAVMTVGANQINERAHDHLASWVLDVWRR